MAAKAKFKVMSKTETERGVEISLRSSACAINSAFFTMPETTKGVPPLSLTVVLPRVAPAAAADFVVGCEYEMTFNLITGDSN